MKKRFLQWWKEFLSDDIGKVGLVIFIVGIFVLLYGFQFIML